MDVKDGKDNAPVAGYSLSHVFAAFDGDGERRSALAAALKMALAADRNVLWVVDHQLVTSEVKVLRQAGIDLDELRMEGRLRLVPPAEAGRPGHFFDDARAMAESAAAEGRAGLHLVIEMSHLLAASKPERAAEFERKLDRFCRAAGATALCLYDRIHLDSLMALDALEIHPAVAFGEAVLENHRYCAPASAYEGGAAGGELSRRLDEILGIEGERRSLELARSALGAAIESLAGYGMLVMRDGSVDIANSMAAERFFGGKAVTGAPGRPFHLPKKAAKVIKDRLGEAAGSGRAVEVEFGDGVETLRGTVVPFGAPGGASYGGVVHLVRPSGGPPVAEAQSASGPAQEGEGDASELWQRVIDAMPDSVCILDADNIITHCNKATESLLSMPSDEILGRQCWEVFHGSSGPVGNCPVKRCKETMVRHTSQFELAGRWTELVADPICGESGSFKGAVHICRDITEQRNYEETLRRERDLSSGIVSTVPVGVALVDRHGKFTYANEYAAQKLGLKRDPSGGGFFSPGDPEGAAGAAHLLPFGAVKETLRPLSGQQMEIHTEGGRRLFLSVNAAPILDQIGGFDGMVISVEDISDRVLAEESMHIKDRAMESSITGIAISDAEGRLSYVNPSFLSMWGYASDVQVLGRMATEFWESQEQADSVLGGLRETGSWIGEMTGVRRDRSKFSVQISASLVRDESGKAVCMMASFVDISERKEFNTKLQDQMSFLEATIEALPHPFYVIDANTYEVKMANSAARSVWSSGGKTCFSAVYGKTSPCKAQGIQCPLDEIRRTGAAVRVEHTRYAADGSAKVYEVHGYPIFGADRRISQMIEYSIDITERKRAEEALRASEIRNRTMLRAIPDLVFVLSREGVFLDYQAKSEEELLLKPQEFLGKNISSVFPGEEGRVVQENFGELLRRGGVRAFDLELQVGDATRFYDARMIALDSNRILALLRDISKRKMAEEALQREKKFVENLIETANAMVVGLDLSGNITIFNEAAAKITGYSPEELRGKNWFEVLVPRNRYPQVWEAFEQLQKGGLPRSMENPILTKAGEERYIVWKNSPIYERDAVVGTISFGIDITARKLAEYALRLSEDRFRRTFSHAPVGVAITGLDLRFQSVNPAYCELVGYTEEQLKNMNVSQITHPDDSTKDEAGVRRLLRGEIEVHNAEKRYIRSDGSTVWVSVSVRLLRDQDGKPLSFLPVVSNITDRKLAEIRLMEKESQLDAIFQNSQDAIGISKDGIHTFANRAYLDMFGYTDNSELEGKPIINRVAPFQRALVADFGAKRTAGEPAPSHYVSRAVRKDGTEFDLQVKATAVVLGGETHIIAVMRDITGQKGEMAPLTLPLPDGGASRAEIERRVAEGLRFVSDVLDFGGQAGGRGVGRPGRAGEIVRAAAIVHDALSGQNAQAEAGAADFLSVAAMGLAELHFGLGCGDRVALEAESFNMDAESLLPLGMILSEFFGFMASGAPISGGGPEIGVRLRIVDGGAATLTVERFDRPKTGYRKAGTGDLDFAKALAARLGGTVRAYTAKCWRAVLTFKPDRG